MSSRAIRLAAALLILAASRLGLADSAGGGFKSDVLASIDDAGKKLVDLAQAMPAEKFGWRPASGVRSVSEVYVHVAAGNYFLPTFVGVKRPEGMDRTMETKITEKSQVIDTLKKSIAHLKNAVEGVPDADLDKPVKFFGRDLTERAILLHAVNHMHEHLGQSIAYARMNGVVPPWSESESAPKKSSAP